MNINKKYVFKILNFLYDGEGSYVRPGNYSVNYEHLKKALLHFVKTDNNILDELDVLIHASWGNLEDGEFLTDETEIILRDFVNNDGNWHYKDFNADIVSQIHKKFIQHLRNKEIIESYLYKRKIFSQISIAEKNEIKQKLGNICKLCGTTKDLTIDHIIPLSKGGDNILENYQILCRSCNSKKGTKINKEN
jgi:5-methylcytosine-specific restriction endonuclease McrA